MLSQQTLARIRVEVYSLRMDAFSDPRWRAAVCGVERLSDLFFSSFSDRRLQRQYETYLLSQLKCVLETLKPVKS